MFVWSLPKNSSRRFEQVEGASHLRDKQAGRRASSGFTIAALDNDPERLWTISNPCGNPAHEFYGL
jgi:hypothetical protein